MIFQAYSINSQAVGVDLLSWSEDDLMGNDAFIFAPSVISGYIAIDTIENVFNLGMNADVDYKFVRDNIKNKVIATGNANIISTLSDPPSSPTTGDAYIIGAAATGVWTGKEGQVAVWDTDWIYYQGDGSASPVEEYGFTFYYGTPAMTIGAKMLIGTVTQQIAAYNFDFAAKAADQAEYKRDVQRCRTNRYKYVENDFLQNIPQYAGIALSEIGLMNIYYTNQGIDGEYYGDTGITGFGDWIQGYGAFSGAGLRNKPWVTLLGLNMNQYADYLADLLFDTGLNREQQQLVEKW